MNNLIRTCVLDPVFGSKNFRNEIVWSYHRWTGAAQSFQKMHDSIFWYTKSDTYTFHLQYEITPNLEKKYKQGYLIGGGAGSTGLIIYDRENKKAQELAQSGKYIVRYEEPKGVQINDVWSIPFINPQAKERIGFPTQKPEKLLERIILASSNEGDSK